MQDIKIWHNPRCSKSRDAMNLLEENSVEAEVVKYLVDTPSIDELKSVLSKLNISPRELMRTKESIYKELDLANEQNDEKLIEAMINNPKLIERPVVITKDGAAIGRPLENIQKLLNL